MLIIVSSSNSSPECHLSFSAVHFLLDILPNLKFMDINTNSSHSNFKKRVFDIIHFLFKKKYRIVPCCLLNYIQGLQYNIQGSTQYILTPYFQPFFSLLFHTHLLLKTNFRLLHFQYSRIFLLPFVCSFLILGLEFYLLPYPLSKCSYSFKTLIILTCFMKFPSSPHRDIIMSF